MERTPSELLKDDSLSIYDKTLYKLQLGYHRDLSLISDESMNSDTSPSMATNKALVTMNACIDSFPSSKEEPHDNMSLFFVLY
ncbi:unnamed protein product [Lactuca virosa]|uniref:Uncharacterized protein n=1 Tax=Lactuca virosa TaxID=75947 RepID=A0AAU9MAQ9_9ASTR|nr:unnamed protein product [Lactuca virosa]